MTMFDNKKSRPGLIVLLLGIVSLVWISGCEDELLNQDPRGELSNQNFLENETQAIQATNATYQAMREFNVHSFPWIGMTDIASDDADKGSTPADNPEMLSIDNFTFTATNGLLGGPWQAYYEGIFRANFAINGIPEIQDINQDIQQRLIAENKFLRAYFYFFLVRAYGGVPVLTENFEVGEDFEVPRAPVDSVYALIERDLGDAIESLPLKSEYSAENIGRITRGAAQGMLAKVHLFQEEFEQAEQQARAVIESGEYSLFDDYSTLFSEEGENSSESVFEVQAVAVQTEAGGTQYSEVQGVRGVPNLGWGFNAPSQNLLNSYETGDPRLEPTILFVHEVLPSNEDVVHDNPNMENERYNQKPFIPISNPGGNGNSGYNIRRLRYADILLIAAEAAYRNGNEADARDFVNQVRARARQGRTATIGLHVEPLPQLIADTLGLPGGEVPSPIIRFVSPGSPAEGAGAQSFAFQLANDNTVIQVNNLDIIQQVDGQQVTTPQSFYSIMQTKNAGDPVSLEILRVSQTLEGSEVQTTTENVSITANAETLLPDIAASGQALLEAIWHERRMELAMEQHRFFDLVRQERAAEVLQAVGKDFEEGKHEVYPIPQEEIDLSGLEQNPGY